MWAVGCVIYWLLCGYTPFRASTIPRVLCNIERGRYSTGTPVMTFSCIATTIPFSKVGDSRHDSSLLEG